MPTTHSSGPKAMFGVRKAPKTCRSAKIGGCRQFACGLTCGAPDCDGRTHAEVAEMLAARDAARRAARMAQSAWT